jgi:hypothetical protein
METNANWNIPTKTTNRQAEARGGGNAPVSTGTDFNMIWSKAFELKA